MEEVIKIEGGKLLEGSIKVSGAKNATVALIPACVLATDIVKIVGIPNISDVRSLKEILEYMNVKVTTPSLDSMVIDPREMVNKPLVIDAVSKLRASYYFMGGLLGKYKKVIIRMPGGCNLGPRPIDLHLKGFKALGADIQYQDDNYIISADKLVGTKIYLDIASVGATINIIMAAVYAQGETTIENAAREPEIIDCITLLNEMGADIRGGGTSKITINGVEKLSGCFHEIIPDRIEAGTYLILAAAMAKQVTIENVIPYHLESLISKLIEMGVEIDSQIDKIVVRKSDNCLKKVDIKTMPYPGFATDLQAPLTALLTQAVGNSSVTETIYKERFKHCQQLNKMGANIIITPPSAIVVGPTSLSGTDVWATDLRCGAALVIAALMAKGTTIIHDIYHIDRGYEDIVSKLSDLGANIRREII
ncbi:MAG: UDP-N-acetylglucosamine 1-carboxyvinyltransferase [Erysipelotrichaceae bacterium]|nr:UDP-N-acetylglucosamine 1-carboxyvinyltransferase [Erysipelotrichaceae bacterium]